MSLGLSTAALSAEDMATAVMDILHQHGWHEAAFVAHSYGTFVCSRIAQRFRPQVQSMVGCLMGSGLG